jgi:molybdopterin converting factor small subunit
MAEVKFAQNLQRHLSTPPDEVHGTTVGEALQAVLARNPRLRGYLLDERGRLRKQIVVFINGALIEDRLRLTDPIDPASELYVMQALS